MKKLVNNELVDCTQADLEMLENDKLNALLEFDSLMLNLRLRRNQLLAETDFYALSDVSMSDDMTKYRKDLRDITEGLSTVEDVKSVTWPTKP
tara:strand:- start:298 stop:576 length:279 start_codon:yes stop_codon:yes gene_type:complete